MFANFKNIWSILENLSRARKNLNLDIFLFLIHTINLVEKAFIM